MKLCEYWFIYVNIDLRHHYGICEAKPFTCLTKDPPVKRSRKRKMTSQTKSNYSVTMLITLNLIRILKRKKDEKATTVTKRLSALWSPSLY